MELLYLLLKISLASIFSHQTGTSALFFAAQGGFIDIVKELISHEAPVDVPSYVSSKF